MAQTLPKDSLILVSGANGYLASHLIDHLLEAGYRVRGTVRDLERTSWIEAYFNNKYGEGRFERVQVANISESNCFDQAIKGTSAFAHMASDLTGNPDPSVSVTPMVAGVKNALTAAAGEKGCKAFVLTSSCVAAVTARPNIKYHIDRHSWNEEAIKEAFTEPHENTPRKRWAAYGASKALGEQAAWKFIEDHKSDLHFTFNTIVPNANFGAIIDPQNQPGSAAGWIREIYTPGHMPGLVQAVQPQWFVHTLDTVKLHVACLTDLQLNNERLLAFSEPFHWDGVLAILRQLNPDRHELLPDLNYRAGDDRDLSTVDNERALQILNSHFGQREWLTLERGLKDLTDSLFPENQEV